MLLQPALRGVVSALRQYWLEGVRRCERPVSTPACSKAAIPLSAHSGHGCLAPESVAEPKFVSARKRTLAAVIDHMGQIQTSSLRRRAPA